jgi:hypothetical protein
MKEIERKDSPQLSMVETELEMIIKMDHELCLLAEKINWEINHRLNLLVSERTCPL